LSPDLQTCSVAFDIAFSWKGQVKPCLEKRLLEYKAQLSHCYPDHRTGRNKQLANLAEVDQCGDQW